jgi:hypothetical protein
MKLTVLTKTTLDGSDDLLKDTPYAGEDFKINLNLLNRSQRGKIINDSMVNGEVVDAEANKQLFLAAFLSAENLQIEVDGKLLKPNSPAFAEYLFEQFIELADAVTAKALGA